MWAPGSLWASFFLSEIRSPLHLCLPSICPFVFLRTQKLLFPRSAVPAQFLAHIFSYFTPLLQEHKSLSFLPAVACNYFSFCSSLSPLPSASLGLFPSFSGCQGESFSPSLSLPENWPLFCREEQEQGAQATSCFCGISMLHVGEGLLIIQPGWAPNCQFLWKIYIYSRQGVSLVFVPLNHRWLCPTWLLSPCLQRSQSHWQLYEPLMFYSYF